MTFELFCEWEKDGIGSVNQCRVQDKKSERADNKIGSRHNGQQGNEGIECVSSEFIVGGWAPIATMNG